MDEVVNRLLNERGLIENRGEFGVAAHLVLQFRQGVVHGVCNIDSVRVRGLRHRQGERLFAVGARNAFNRCGHLLDLSNLGQLDRTVLAGDLQVADLVELCDAHADFDRCVPVVAFDFTGRGGNAVGLQDAGDFIDADTLVFDLFLVNRDVDLFDVSAGHRGCAHAGQLLQFGDDNRIEVIGQFFFVTVRSD